VTVGDREPFFAELAPDRSHWRVRWRLAAAGAPPLRVLPGARAGRGVPGSLRARVRGRACGDGRRALRRDLCALLGAAMATAAAPD
jgi:hypothetical protein